MFGSETLEDVSFTNAHTNMLREERLRVIPMIFLTKKTGRPNKGKKNRENDTNWSSQKSRQQWEGNTLKRKSYSVRNFFCTIIGEIILAWAR